MDTYPKKVKVYICRVLFGLELETYKNLSYIIYWTLNNSKHIYSVRDIRLQLPVEKYKCIKNV